MLSWARYASKVLQHTPLSVVGVFFCPHCDPFMILTGAKICACRVVILSRCTAVSLLLPLPATCYHAMSVFTRRDRGHRCRRTHLLYVPYCFQSFLLAVHLFVVCEGLASDRHEANDSRAHPSKSRDKLGGGRSGLARGHGYDEDDWRAPGGERRHGHAHGHAH